MTRVEDVTAIVPVKAWGLGKSRLVVSAEERRDLARAFSLDVISAVAGSSRVGRVVLVSSERDLGRTSQAVGAVIIADPPTAGEPLRTAVDLAWRWASRSLPERPVVVVPSDLPSLTTDALDGALDQLGRHARAFVPDSDGSGTTLLWASSPPLFASCYGPRSAVRHARAGFHCVTDVDLRARRDVDTVADLMEARLLGVGGCTTATLERHSARL